MSSVEFESYVVTTKEFEGFLLVFFYLPFSCRSGWQWEEWKAEIQYCDKASRGDFGC